MISATQGFYSDYHITEKTRGSGRQLWISPLMPIYWFFNLQAAARQSLVLDTIKDTDTFAQARETIRNVIEGLPKRPYGRIPLG